ncbi:hypothetical protein O0235_01430 [Tepidiforma flava]|uniref:Urea ABC transporter permease subunit UrtB n=1 Tax=Tepidiforma flava TaxID=3004094 RepID=A0ABY7MDU5_9CHLR|nr:hypothetical protein O0235_01430 [Tepidiforma flava]
MRLPRPAAPRRAARVQRPRHQLPPRAAGRVRRRRARRHGPRSDAHPPALRPAAGYAARHLGVSLVLQQLARSIFGAPNVQVTTPSWLQGGIAVTGSFTMPYIRLFIIAMVLAAVALVWLYLVRTAAGRRTRATMQNREVAAALGVRTPRVDMLTFGLGSGLAGLAGCALALLGPIGPSLGTYYIVDSFLVVILGGIGQVVGTAIAALAIGGANALLEFQLSASVAKVLVFALVIAFLQWRPAGIIARRAAR